MVENQALQDAFGRPRQLSTSSPFATASSISEPFTTCHSTPGALSPRSRSASTSTSSVSSPPTAHLSRASIKDHKSLHRGALHAGMGNFGTDPKSFYQNFSQLGAQSMVPAHTSQAASSSDALGHHSEANVNCRFPYPHGHDQDGGCLPPALTLCDPSCGISGPHSPHSHGTSSLATYGATPSLAPAGALQTGHAVEQQHGATEAQTFVCQWGGCGRCWSTVEQLVAHVNEEHLVPSFTAMSQSVPWGQVSGAGYATGSSQQLLGAAGLSQQQQASIAQMTIPDQHSSSPGNLHFATCLWNDCHLVPLPESRNLTSVNGDSNSNSPNAYPNTAKTLPLLQHLLTEHLGQNVHDSWPALGNVDILSGLGNAAFSGKLDHAVQPYAKSEASKIGRKRQRLRPDTANHETNKRMRRNRNSNSGQSPDGEDHYAIAPGARTLHGSFSDSIHPTKDHPSTFGSLSLSVTPSEEAEEHSDDDDSTSEDGERVATMQAPKTVNGASTRRGGKSRDLLASSGCGCASAQPGGTGQHACGWVGCSMSFPTHEGLTEHIGSVHVGSGKAEYECGWEGCERAKEGRKFSQRQKVMRHLQTHTGESSTFFSTDCTSPFS